MNTGDAYLNALNRRKKLLEELKRIDAFLELYREFSGVDVPAPATIPEQPAQPARRRRLTQEQFTEIAVKLLKERGRPATRSEFLRLLREKGVQIGGVNELKNLGTKLWRAQNVIINIPPHGYWLKEVPCPAIRYRGPPDNKETGDGDAGESIGSGTITASLTVGNS